MESQHFPSLVGFIGILGTRAVGGAALADVVDRALHARETVLNVGGAA